MATALVRQMLCATLLAGSLIACGTKVPNPGDRQSTTLDLPAITASVAAATHYPADTLEILTGPSRLRISIRDSQLAVSDEGSRNAAATAVVAACEQVLAAHPEFSTVEAISVSIIHGNPTAEGAVGKDWHIEDVIEFRKGPSGRFSIHVT